MKFVVRQIDRRGFEYSIYVNNELQAQGTEREREFDLPVFKNSALAVNLIQLKLNVI